MLAKYLKIFETYKVNLLHIESRASTKVADRYEFVIECAPSGDLGSAITEIKESSDYFNIISTNYANNQGEYTCYTDLHLYEIQINTSIQSTDVLRLNKYQHGS